MPQIERWSLPDVDDGFRYVVLDDTSGERNSRIYYCRYQDTVGELDTSGDPAVVREWRLPVTLADAPDPSPLSICFSPNDHLWFATESPGRIVRFHPNESRFVAYRCPRVTTVYAVMPDGADNCWFIGPRTVGVLAAGGRRVLRWELPDELPGPSSLWAQPDKKAAWIAAQNVLGSFEPWIARIDPATGVLRAFVLRPASRSTSVRICGDAGPQNLWLVAASFAYRLNLVEKRLYVYPENGWNLVDIDLDGDGSAWIGRFDRSIARIKRDADCGHGSFEVRTFKLKTIEARPSSVEVTVAPQTSTTPRIVTSVVAARAPCSTRWPTPNMNGSPIGVAASASEPGKPRICFGTSFPHTIARLTP